MSNKQIDAVLDTALSQILKANLKHGLFILHYRLVKCQIWEFHSSDVLKPFK